MRARQILCAFLLASSAATVFAERQRPGGVSSAAPIREEMGGLFIALSELLPMVVDKAAFENPKNAKNITSLMQKLQDLADKMVVSTKKFADNDPSIPFIAEKFSNDVTMALDMWKSGDRVVPRRLMRGVTDYCISCHTRTSKGLHLTEVIPSAKFKAMPVLARAEYLAATRQFEGALKQYEDALVRRPLAKIDPQAWDEGVRKMLAIAVRVENKPRLTMELLSSIQDSPDTMLPSLRFDIAQWRQAAKQWANEKKSPSMTSSEKFALAKRLVAEGQQIAKNNPGSALIQFLRASALLHELLGKIPAKDQSQEMLWLAGEAADYLSELNLWTVQDVYYEACARKKRDPKLTNRCYSALEASLIDSYGASSKAGLPEFVKKHLESVK